jgi:iron complex outermembrane recepter protein
VAGVCGGPNDRSRYGIYFDAATGNAYRDIGASWSEVTGVVGLDWTPDEDTLIYGKYNRGYKPGGIGAADTNGNLVVTPYTDQELVNAYELGFKRDWRAANLVTNAVLFYYDYQGYQVSNQIIPEDPDGAGPAVRPPPYTSYVNLPETVTTGFELETIWRPIDPLRILFNYGYTNPEIGTSPSLVHNLDPFARDPSAKPLGTPGPIVAGQGAGLQGQSLEGNILPFSPKNKAAVVGTYTWDLESGSEINASLSYFWQDISFSSIFNRSYTKIPSWDQTDGRVTWTNSDRNVTLIGFVRNIFDEVAYDNRASGIREGTLRNVAPQSCGTSVATSVVHSAANPLGSLAQSCLTTTETYRPPRTYGVELQFRF